MDWIKKRYDQFLLAVIATALLVFAIVVYLKTSSFGDKFTDALANVPANNEIPLLVLDRVEEAKVALQKPPVWIIDNSDPRTRGSLLVSEPYFIGPEGTPKTLGEGSLRRDSLTGKPIPDRWFKQNNINPLEATAALQDADKDGFANEDEWRENTDPNNKDSHPPYYTKLFFKSIVRNRFRLIFNAVNGDLKKPETLEFQINTVDLKQPSEFLRIGDPVPHTKFKLEKFEFKEVLNPNTKEMMDVSELTLVNTETNDPVTLVITRVTDSPDVFCIFEYEWPQPNQEIRVKKIQDFGLKPETDKDKLYKLIDIRETEAVIRLPDGRTYTVVRDPRRAVK